MKNYYLINIIIKAITDEETVQFLQQNVPLKLILTQNLPVHIIFCIIERKTHFCKQTIKSCAFLDLTNRFETEIYMSNEHLTYIHMREKLKIHKTKNRVQNVLLVLLTQ